MEGRPACARTAARAAPTPLTRQSNVDKALCQLGTELLSLCAERALILATAAAAATDGQDQQAGEHPQRGELRIRFHARYSSIEGMPIHSGLEGTALPVSPNLRKRCPPLYQSAWGQVNN